MVRKSGQHARSATAKQQGGGAISKQPGKRGRNSGAAGARSGHGSNQAWQQPSSQCDVGVQLPQGLATMLPPPGNAPLAPMQTGDAAGCGLPPAGGGFMHMGWPCDLHTALQRMGLLPCLPTPLPEPLVQQRQPHAPTPAAPQYLAHLNAFLDNSYCLQQKGHQLWLAEQYELQRGADLAIISPPNPPAPQPAPAATPVKAAHRPGLVNGEEPQPARSPTDLLMSPQMLAAAMGAGAGGLSSPVAGGCSTVTLLSPTACGLHPLLLQELPGSARRRLLSPHAAVGVVTTNSFLVDEHVQGGAGIDMGDVDLGEDTDLLPGRALMYPDFHIHHAQVLPKVEREEAAGGLGPLHIAPLQVPQHAQHAGHAKLGLRAAHATPTRHHHHHAGILATALDHVGSPLSPADLLTYSAAAGAHGPCMDMGLLGGYSGIPAQLESDIHAELRLEAGLKRRR